MSLITFKQANVVWERIIKGKEIKAPPQLAKVFGTTVNPVDDRLWSVVLEFDIKHGEMDWVTKGRIRFLVPDGPMDMLRKGAEIPIYNGPHLMAKAFIID